MRGVARFVGLVLLVSIPFIILRIRRIPRAPPVPEPEEEQHDEDPASAEARRRVLPVVRAKAEELHRSFALIREAVEEGARQASQALAAPPRPGSPPLHAAEQVAAWAKDPSSRFAREDHRRRPYAVYHLAPGAPLHPESLARLAALGAYFQKTYQWLPLCRSVYLGHADGFLIGYPGGEPFPPAYDPRLREWYLKAERLGRGAWTDPYVDKNGRDLVITAAQPVLKGAETAAVAAVDVTLTEMVRRLFDLSGLPVEDAILADEQGWVRAAAEYGEPPTTPTKKLPSLPEPDFQARHVSEYEEGSFQPAFRRIAESPGTASGLVPEPGGGTVFAYARVPLDADQTWYYVARVRR